MDLEGCIRELERFSDGDLRRKLKDIENHLVRGDAETCIDLNSHLSVGSDLLEAAATVKRAAAQIDVLIHSIGILHLLPAILQVGERVQYLSLGAGNTGKKFDLETDRQVAEFTFIAWRGGSEAIRQSKLFVDFLHLAEAATTKERNLYVLGAHHPTKFLRSKRTLKSVLSRRPDELRLIDSLYGERFLTVRDYYDYQSGQVNLRDMELAMPAALLAIPVAIESES